MTGLKGWWKADALSLSNNDPVSSWPTAGTGGANFEWQQGTSANQPTYKTGGPNGLPYVNWDGTNDQMFLAAQSSTTDSTQTIIAVLAPNSPLNVFKTVFSTRKVPMYYAVDSPDSAWGSFLTVVLLGNDLPTAGVWCILAIVYRAANDIDLYSLGVKVNRTAGSGGGAFWGVLGSGDGQQFANMKLGEVCYYDNALSETDVRNIAEGLVAKWNAV